MHPPWVPDCTKTVLQFLLLKLFLSPIYATKVYLDRYGDCSRETYIPVKANEEYSILSHGAEAFDTLVCEISFRSEQNDRLCLHFRRFYISKCDVKFEVYSEQSASGKALGSYNCHTDDIPTSVCSNSRYLTILFKKKELSHDGYDFSMELREMTQSDAFGEGLDAFILSIGVIIAIIVGVIIIVVVAAVAIICCCCKNKHQYRRTPKSASGRSGQERVPVEPTAPPFPADDRPPSYTDSPPPYSSDQEAPSPTAPPADKVYV